MCTPIAKILSLKLSPLKRTRNPWSVVESMTWSKKNQDGFLILCCHQETWMLSRMVLLFTIARTWKHPRCPSADEWIRKLWYIYTMEYYSAIKNNAFETVLMRWMKLEPIIQSEVSQKEKHQYSILLHIYGI